MTTKTPAYTLRYATEADIPVILQLINELADYEKALHEVQATPEKLKATLSFLIPDSSSSPSTDQAIGDGGAPQELKFSPGFAKTLLICPHHDPNSGNISPPPANGVNGHHTDNHPDRSHQVAGLAMYFHNYSTWHAAPGIYLEELFVRPQYRGRGYGQALLKALARECLRLGCKRLEWSVLKWNTPSIGFYESEAVGAKTMSEWNTMRVDGERLEKLGSR